MRYLTLIPLFLLGIILASCEGQHANESPSFGYSMESDKHYYNEVETQNGDKSQAGIERKLKKTGNVSFECVAFRDTRNQLRDLVAAHDGYFSNDKESQGNRRMNGNMQAKIPVQNFDRFMADLEAIVPKFESKDVAIDDVTAEFVDVEGQIRSKRALEARFLEIIKSAENVEELLNVERQLEQVRAELELYEGRRKLMLHETTYATLNIHYFVPIAYEKTERQADFGGAFVTGWKGLVFGLEVLLTIWPVLLGGFLLVFFLRRKLILKRVKK
ncbi:DUF4349 domain-containing protein [Sanyastnella coralliicola]|uniref:DUF4349 domain-containing protein n=1 Tax=Sanyastnella coralliicola TaxID=3069118 RepID=UPI0027BAE449|nr:DUF4349 domain-containing protein [Longitalea sp. SCSIO 12813]